MTANRADVFRVLGYVESDLRKIHSRLTEVRAMLAAGAMTNTPVETPCPECSRPFTSAAVLTNHRYDAHGVGVVCLDCGQVTEVEHEHPGLAE